MKYFEVPELEALNAQLSRIDAGELRLFGRVECYTCKSTESDRKLKALLDGKYTGIPSPASSVSPPMQGASSLPIRDPQLARKCLFYLIATLNAAYPDYDFTDVKPDCFTQLPSVRLVMHRIQNQLLDSTAAQGEWTDLFDTRIWEAVSKLIPLEECDIFQFHADPDCEPDGDEANLWSFHYFFLSRKVKRMVFFTCRAVSFLNPQTPDLSSEFDAVADEFQALDSPERPEKRRRTRVASFDQYIMQQTVI